MQDDGPPPSDGFSKAFEAWAQKPENANTDLEVGDELPADVLRELLAAVAVYAAGGRAALEDKAKRDGGAVLKLTHQMGGSKS